MKDRSYLNIVECKEGSTGFKKFPHCRSYLNIVECKVNSYATIQTFFFK